MISSRNIYLACLLILPLVDSHLQATSGYVSQTNSVIPFELVQGKVVVKALVNGRFGYFIVDTAYPHLALNHRLFKGKVREGNIQGVNSVDSPSAKTLVDFSLGNIEITSAYAEIVDLDRIVASRKIQFSGLIGAQIFKDHTVLFDFESKQLILRRHAEKRIDADQWPSTAGQVFRLTSKGHLLCLRVHIADVPFQFALDTAAGSNLIAERKIFPIEQAVEYVDQRKLGGIGEADVIVDRVKLSEVELGDIKYPAMYTLLCDLRRINLDLPGKSIDGILGYPFFRSHLLAIDFKTRTLIIWPKTETLPPAAPSWYTNRKISRY